MVNKIKAKSSRYQDVHKRILFILFSFLLCAECWAQYDVSFAHYFDMEPSFNAASVGKQSKINIVGAYALDFAGYENNPRSMYIAADAPFYLAKAYHGAGVQLLNDEIGLFTHQRLTLQYAYKHKLFGGTISAGIQASLLSEKFEGSKLDPGDSGDPALTKADINGSGFDLGAGIYYVRGPLYVGISALHLTSPKIDLGETNELQIDPSFYLTGGYNIKLRNPFLTIKPSVLARYDGVAFRADITGRLVYQNEEKTMYGGVSYSPTNSVTFLVGGSFHGVLVGYSYELYTSAISPGNGSHELFVGYQIDVNLVKKGKNKHQSTRIL